MGADALLLCENAGTARDDDTERSDATFRRALEEAHSYHSAWTARPFQFSACLDSNVAVAVVSFALAIHRQRHRGATRLPSLLDACTGSGTLAAAAARTSCFGEIWATDANADFLE